MIAALWANPNWDDTKESKGNRKSAIEGINSDFEETLEAVEAAMSSRVVPDEEKLSDDNPFFAAAERGLQKIEQKAKQSGGNNYSPSESEEVDYREIDQA